MLSVFSFLKNAATLHHTRCSEFPVRLFADRSITIDLDYQNQDIIVKSTRPVCVNNQATRFARVAFGDVIGWDNWVFILAPECPYGSQLFYTGRVKYKNTPAFLFTAPEQVYAGFFLQLSQMISYYPEIRQIVINCQAVTYMDSESVSAMISLVHLARNQHCDLYFYAPSHRFHSYLTLSNTGKFITEIPPVASIQNSMNGICPNEGQNLFVLGNMDCFYGLKPDRVIFIGRSAEVCSIRIDDPSVSRVHAAMLIIRNSLYVIDLKATNGTYINDKQVPSMTLRAVKVNDQLFFGYTSPFKMLLNEYSVLRGFNKI